MRGCMGEFYIDVTYIIVKFVTMRKKEMDSPFQWYTTDKTVTESILEASVQRLVDTNAPMFIEQGNGCLVISDPIFKLWYKAL